MCDYLSFVLYGDGRGLEVACDTTLTSHHDALNYMRQRKIDLLYFWEVEWFSAHPVDSMDVRTPPWGFDQRPIYSSDTLESMVRQMFPNRAKLEWHLLSNLLKNGSLPMPSAMGVDKKGHVHYQNSEMFRFFDLGKQDHPYRLHLLNRIVAHVDKTYSRLFPSYSTWHKEVSEILDSYGHDGGAVRAEDAEAILPSIYLSRPEQLCAVRGILEGVSPLIATKNCWFYFSNDYVADEAGWAKDLIDFTLLARKERLENEQAS